MDRLLKGAGALHVASRERFAAIWIFFVIMICIRSSIKEFIQDLMQVLMTEKVQQQDGGKLEVGDRCS